MNLQQLQYFLTSARKGSLTKAAEELYTSQPHVSQVIRSLEQELGVTLFHRTGTGISLTRQGQDIRYYAENTLKNASIIQEVCQESREQSLKLAVNSSSWLAYLGGEYFLDHMEDVINFRYTECRTEEMLGLLQNQNYDLGFLFVPVNKMTALEHMIRRRHIEYRELLSSDLVVHSGPESPYYGKSLLEPEDLDRCSCIQMEDDFFSVEDLLMTHKDFYSGRRRLRKVVRTNSNHLMIRMLQQTDLCNIGSYWMRGGYGDRRFSISVVNGFQGMVSFGYLSPAGKSLSREAEEFLDRLRTRLEEDRSRNSL